MADGVAPKRSALGMGLVIGLLVMVGVFYTSIVRKYIRMYEDTQVELSGVSALVARVVTGGVLLKVLAALGAVGVSAVATAAGLRGGEGRAVLVVLAVALGLLLVAGVIAIFNPMIQLVTEPGSGP